MTEDEIVRWMIAAYVVEVIVAIWAYVGIFRLWRDEGGRVNRVWTALVVMKGLAVAGAILTLPVAGVALLNLPRLPFTGVTVTLVMMLQLAAVIVYRLVFGRIRRERGHVAETVQQEGDDDDSLRSA